MRTINIIFNLTYYLKLCNAKVTNYIYIHISFCCQQRSNWLFGHQWSLKYLLGKKHINGDKINHFVTPNSKWHYYI